MIIQNLNTELINAMKRYLPQDSNLANNLMDILYIGKEATYRRLRGEVPFTFAEVATISQQMGISLDKIVGSMRQENAIFDLNLLHYSTPMDNYLSIVSSYIELFKRLSAESVSTLSVASNVIPPTLYLRYEALSKFRLFKWLYHQEESSTHKHYEELQIPTKLMDKQKEFVAVSQLFQSSYYIWDKETFPRLIRDIKYFSDIGLIAKDNVQELKAELFALLEELEDVSSKGRFRTGKEVQMYISNINFETSYSYVETMDYHLSLIRVFSINSITTLDDFVFKNLKDWIVSLKKYSTLISQSNEMERVRFFNEQQEIVNEL